MSARVPESGSEGPPSSPPRTLAIALSVCLLIVSSAILLVTAFVLCCRRRRDDRPGSDTQHGVPAVIDDNAAAIRSLPGVGTTTLPPAFSFAPGQDGDHGGSCALECAVCLGAVKEGEMVRQLPTCMHVYHVGCIDRWLAAHQTCPVCRSIAA